MSCKCAFATVLRFVECASVFMDGLLTAIMGQMTTRNLNLRRKNMENADYGCVSQSKEPRIVPL